MATAISGKSCVFDLVQRIATEGFGERCADYLGRLVSVHQGIVVEQNPCGLSLTFPSYGGSRYELRKDGKCRTTLILRSVSGRVFEFTETGYRQVKPGTRTAGYRMKSGVFEKRVEEAARALYN